MKKKKTTKQRKPPSRPVYRYTATGNCVIDNDHPEMTVPVVIGKFTSYYNDQKKNVKEASKMAQKCARMLNPLKVSSRKSKGASLQKWVAQKISKLTGFACGKDKPIEARSMGQSGTDVRLEQRVLDVFPFSIECKNQETWEVPAWIEQAKSNQIKNTYWLLVMKKKNMKPVVAMDAEEFFSMLAGNTARL